MAKCEGKTTKLGLNDAIKLSPKGLGAILPTELRLYGNSIFKIVRTV